MVMAGGSGTRFWPLSRRAWPKQFLALAGERPLLVETVARLAPLAKPEDTLVILGPAHEKAARRMLPELPRRNILVEPCARNTAPCVGLAALHVRRRDPEGVLLMLPADHHVARPAALRSALAAAARLAGQGNIATIGLKPSRPETGYGYLEVGAPLEPSATKGRGKGKSAGFRVKRFVEKPDLASAERYLAGGGYLWNSGIFAFRADVILEEIARRMPDLSVILEGIDAHLGTRREGATLARLFPRSPAISIDYGVMERSDRVVVVPADFGWSDLGSFAALPEVRPADGDGNVTEGDALVLGKGNVVLARGGRTVAVVGVDDLVVVDAGDAVLVCPRSKAQDVRQAVDELRRRGREDLI